MKEIIGLFCLAGAGVWLLCGVIVLRQLGRKGRQDLQD